MSSPKYVLAEISNECCVTLSVYTFLPHTTVGAVQPAIFHNSETSSFEAFWRERVPNIHLESICRIQLEFEDNVLELRYDKSPLTGESFGTWLNRRMMGILRHQHNVTINVWVTPSIPNSLPMTLTAEHWKSMWEEPLSAHRDEILRIAQASTPYETLGIPSLTRRSLGDKMCQLRDRLVSDDPLCGLVRQRLDDAYNSLSPFYPNADVVHQRFADAKEDRESCDARYNECKTELESLQSQMDTLVRSRWEDAEMSELLEEIKETRDRVAEYERDLQRAGETLESITAEYLRQMEPLYARVPIGSSVGLATGPTAGQIGIVVRHAPEGPTVHIGTEDVVVEWTTIVPIEGVSDDDPQDVCMRSLLCSHKFRHRGACNKRMILTAPCTVCGGKTKSGWTKCKRPCLGGSVNPVIPMDDDSSILLVGDSIGARLASYLPPNVTSHAMAGTSISDLRRQVSGVDFAGYRTILICTGFDDSITLPSDAIYQALTTQIEYLQTVAHSDIVLLVPTCRANLECEDTLTLRLQTPLVRCIPPTFLTRDDFHDHMQLTDMGYTKMRNMVLKSVAHASFTP